jgi:malonate decarboxylase beta subunit
MRITRPATRGIRSSPSSSAPRCPAALTHGLQAGQILALDDPHVEIRHAQGGRRAVTLRTVQQLDESPNHRADELRRSGLGHAGFCGLLAVDNADAPTDDVRKVSAVAGSRMGQARSARPVNRLDRGRRHHSARLPRGP